MFIAAASLCRREIVRFLRQPNRVIGALATPIVFWLLLGAGIGRSFSAGGGGAGNYIRFFFPGTLLMILLFTSIFSTISIIEDRREGFLQSVLIAPIDRWSIVWGKVLGGTSLAVFQAVLFLLLSPLVGARPSILGFAGCLIFMILTAVGLTALGFSIAWRMSSTQGFHAIMNLFLMPLWFLSGALFPPGGSWSPIRAVISANPLYYALAGMRQCLFGVNAAEPSLVTCAAVTVLGSAAMLAVSRIVARRIVSADLQ